MADRTSSVSRVTKETQIEGYLRIEGNGAAKVDTAIPFFDHMLNQLAKHSGMDLSLECTGDVEVDAHHLVEDVGIVTGQLLKGALGDKVGIARFASLALPLDEALVDVAIDLSGRPFLHYGIDHSGQYPLGTPPFDPQLSEEFFRAFAFAADICLHIDLRRGRNAHHIVEATFKAVARTIRSAAQVISNDLPSTKGKL